MRMRNSLYLSLGNVNHKIGEYEATAECYHKVGVIYEQEFGGD